MVLDLIGTGTNAIRNTMDSLLGSPIQKMGDPTGIAGGYGANNLYGGDPTGIRGGFSYGRGGDAFMGLVDQDLASIFSSQQQQQGTPGGGYAGGGQAASAGGQWATLDSLNDAINSASKQLGVPANLIKGVIAREGSFGNDFYTTMVPGHGSPILAFNGIFQETALSHGIDWNRMISDKSYAVWATGKVLKDLYDQYGAQYGWEGVAATYFTGSPTGTQDSAGTQTQDYLYGPNGVITHWRDLDARSGSPSMDPASPMYGGGGMTPSQVVSTAISYVNKVPYVLGAIPGKGETPTAWDCSGMTYWLDQNFGTGTLPMGSHEQYAWGLQNGQIFTDYSQLRPGDLIFMNTGTSYRGNAASHVVMYIGNGKVVHAANPSAGTIISDLASYQGMYPTLGAMHMSWSGGGGYGGGTTTGSSGQPGYQPVMSINDQIYRAMMGLPY